ncbi:complexin-2 [Eurytemora carolleeae]|uniref:complexin-2 n=1 Tax=Eurytemora carolleeae TaxID=1294199 RepID=UPI000C786D7E|nr:complexin-2 [Eurytemora carolleeae]|eukprot:XP_023329117.1 complexin-2-like [Eurytemora affinis]
MASKLAMLAKLTDLKELTGFGGSDEPKKEPPTQKERKDEEKRKEAQRQAEEERRKRHQQEEYQREKVRETIRQKYGIKKPAENSKAKKKEMVAEVAKDYNLSVEDARQLERKIQEIQT